MKPEQDGSVTLEDYDEAVVTHVASGLSPDLCRFDITQPGRYDPTSKTVVLDRGEASGALKALVELAWLNADIRTDHQLRPVMIKSFNVAPDAIRHSIVVASDIAFSMLKKYVGHIPNNPTATEGPWVALNAHELNRSGRKAPSDNPPDIER